jgi:hypothetical protein
MRPMQGFKSKKPHKAREPEFHLSGAAPGNNVGFIHLTSPRISKGARPNRHVSASGARRTINAGSCPPLPGRHEERKRRRPPSAFTYPLSKSYNFYSKSPIWRSDG